MAGNRNYSSVARLAALTGGVTDSATSMTVDQTTGFPTPPFTLVVDPGRPAEEAVTCTAIVGTNLTVVRGVDGTSAQPHDAAAEVRHMATAQDFREPAVHINETSTIHGVTGDLVGTDDTQVLDNKTFTPQGTDHVPVLFKAAAAQTANAFDVTTPGGTVLASMKISGRLATPGVDSTGNSIFIPSSAATVPLITKGVTSQSAALLSARTVADSEVASISPTGLVTGSSVVGTTSVSSAAIIGTSTVTAPSVTGSTSITTPLLNSETIANSTSANLTTNGVGTVPLTVKTVASQTADAIRVRDSADTLKAGVSGATTSFQLFHGTGSSNKVPYRMHGGSFLATILSGNTSVNTVLDLTSYGFDFLPVFLATLKHDDPAAPRWRVTVNTFDATTTSMSIRVFQTEGNTVPSDTVYRVHWMAIQFLPTGADG